MVKMSMRMDYQHNVCRMKSQGFNRMNKQMGCMCISTIKNNEPIPCIYQMTAYFFIPNIIQVSEDFKRLKVILDWICIIITKVV